MRIVVVSATSQIARSCISIWSQNSDHEFILVGRDRTRLESVAEDFALRFQGSSFEVEVIDFQSVESIETLIKKLANKRIDQVLIAPGSLSIQEIASTDLNHLKSELHLNAVSTAVLTEAFAGLLQKQGFGGLGVISSVAADRGRAYNYSYGASKALLDVYTEGLQQRLANTEVKVSLIKPGPTATPMTQGHRGKMASSEAVAKVIVQGLKARKRVIYAPKIWRLIMLVVRAIPWFIFKRLSF